MRTKEQFAEMLTGCEYGSEITKEEIKLAKESGLIVVHGYSDDNCEFEGAISEEIGCYGGGTIKFTKEGKFNKSAANVIKAIWCPRVDGTVVASWAYETTIPHAKFNIYEDGELYCIGMVIDKNDLV